MNKKGGSVASENTIYDLVIKGGRVMDPLTRVDSKANLGLKDGKIAAVLSLEEPTLLA